MEQFQYSETYKHCEDYELWLRISDEYKVGNLSECFTNHRIHKQNTDPEYLKNQKKNALELLSAAMEEWGIDHSVEELALHGAICSAIPGRYFADGHKNEELIEWVDKVLDHLGNRYDLSSTFVQRVKNYVLYDHCGLLQRAEKIRNKADVPSLPM